MKKDATMPNKNLLNHWARWCVIVTAVVFCIVISGCGKSEESPTTPNTDKTATTVNTDKTANIPTAPASKFKLVEWVSQPVGSDAARITTPDGRVTVAVAPGTFTQSGTIVISSIKDETPGFSQAFQPMAVFDICTADNTQPAKPVTVTFNSGEQPARAAWWNEDLEGWLSIPTQHDPKTGITSFTIPHFTLFGWFTEAAGYKRKTIGDFEVIWDAKALDVPKKVTDVSLLVGKILYQSDGNFAKYLKAGEDPKTYDGLPEMVRDTAAYLNYAMRQYKDAGFKTPKGPITVIIETSLTSENARDKALGIIHIGEYNNGSSQLRLAAAHELFHTVQNEYLWAFGGMSYLSWWCECTAEYAGSITWDYSRPARRPAMKYFSEALTSTANEHEYQSAHFIDSIIGPGTVKERLTRLRKLWVGTLGEHGITDMTDITFPMTSYLKAVGHGGVNENFRDHVADLFFSETSPITNTAKGADPKQIPAEMIDTWALLNTSEKTHPQLKMNLKGERRAKAWGVKAQPAKDGRDREIELKVGGPLSGNVQVRVHVLPGDQRSAKAILPTTLINETTPTARVTLGPKDAAYVVVINTAGGGQVDMTLDIKDMAATGSWRLLSADQIKTDAFAPNLKMMRGNARVFSGAGDPFLACAVPADKMDISGRVTYEFDIDGKSGELSTITKWKERIYLDSGKQDADLKLTITRRWTPTLPKILKPNSRIDITETVSMEPSPANLYTHSRFKPDITGLVMTSVDRERLGGSEYTNVASKKWRNAPLEASATYQWMVPVGKPGDRLRLIFRAADSAPANLGQSSGSYLDQFQNAQLLYVYEYSE
jgi:hypothetical protein